ncbi:MAG: CPXCG motif-containing cysteine-rich protein [Woeseia sp.]|nr:CPXCG motif-containing cysteine-rich protein [Woeseia sp.]
MNLSTVEKAIHCPFCDERISIIIDPSIERQNYIEDCEVCCQPIEISCSVNSADSIDLSALCS